MNKLFLLMTLVSIPALAGTVADWKGKGEKFADPEKNFNFVMDTLKKNYVDQGLTTADRQCQAWRSREQLAKLARRWRPGLRRCARPRRATAWLGPSEGSCALPPARS